jgi:energy-coupling factor transporter ATP-binding protein EcfA2
MTDKGVTRASLRLPRPQRVTLRNFSLYRRTKTVNAEFDRNVYCLAGANGLGKSTFLSAINFAICGVVAEPERSFLRPRDYYEDLIPYSSTYFDGRITQGDREAAQVEIEMTVGDREYRLVRGMFAPVGLREFSIRGHDGSIEDYSDPAFDDIERHRHYEAAMLADTGLDDFSQLVFLQLLVLTFDEQRRLLFWDDRVAQAALFLAFGISPEEASRAESLQKTIDSADSLVRNLQWQATGVRRELEALQRATAGSPADDEDLQAVHERLEQRVDDAAAHYERLETAWRDCQVRLADTAASQRAAQNDYEAIYSDRLKTRRHAHAHPLVVTAMNESVCGVCGSEETSVAQTVRSRLTDGDCPFCGSVLIDADPDADAALLEKLRLAGERIVDLEKELDLAQQTVVRLRREADAAESHLRGLRGEFEGFRTANALALARRAVAGAELDDATGGLQRQIDQLLARKDRERARRDEGRVALQQLQGQLVSAYAEAEGQFVPRFRELAELFLGIPVEIDLDRRATALQLRLSLANTDRRTADELSESQRFFIDIALRMSIAEQLATPSDPVFLYVDTPEGSLDIAYEYRAGEMFASFAQGNGRLLITANINTSELLLRLAAKCGADQMKLVRMTEWTSLTDVQQAHDPLFEKAYGAIERTLGQA